MKGKTYGQTGELLRGLGSVEGVFEALTAATGPLRQMFEWEPTPVGPKEWSIRIRSIEGMAPYRELCALMAGIHAAIPSVFGSFGEVVEEQCECDGATECRSSLRWKSPDRYRQQAEFYKARAAVLEGHLRQFQAMVTELVSDVGHDEVMRRIALSAAQAVSVTGAFVVSVSGSPAHIRVSSVGLDAVVAAEIAARILRGDPVEGVFAVDVASSRADHGKLAVVGANAELIARTPGIVESYGRLAAAALDLAAAMTDARRQAETAQALLDLSQSLAQLAGADEMAANVARAVPMLIDCDRSAVLLRATDPAGMPTGDYRLAAGYGYPDHLVASLDSTVLAALAPVVSDEDGLAWRLQTATGSKVAAAAPIVNGGKEIGWVVAGVTHDPARLSANAELARRLKSLAAQAGSAISNARLVDQIRYQSMHDSLTGLPNRALILDRLDQLLSRARRNAIPVAVLFIDLDGFKDVNDTMGHEVGDHLLQAVADRLAATVRDSDTVGRLGGDEFVILVDDATLDAGPELVAERVIDVMREPFEVPGAGDGRIAVTVSIGISTSGGCDASEMLRDADIALYQAKHAGKNAFVVFQAEMQTTLADRHLLEMDLRSALADNQFFLVYQPIFDLHTGHTTGVEALLRWNRPHEGTVSPDRFVGLLEETGQIGDVGAWVLQQACQQGAHWRAMGYDLEMSVNVSARQLESDHFVDQIQHTLATSGFAAESLIVEITETALMRNVAAVIPRLEAVKASGVRVAIDDFGTGYSSLAYLRELPVDTLKIDQSFVSAMGDSPEAGALIHTLVQLGKSLGLKTLAEGIEETRQYAWLRQEDCDKGQGFLYARPLAIDEVPAFLATKMARTALLPAP
jgi:diguanylate cyclase (GGDEF)-like protein